MGGTYNSGVTQVTGTVNATFTATGVTATPLVSSRSSAGTTTLGTVPANKVWRIVNMWMQGKLNNSGDTAIMALNSVNALYMDLSAGATENSICYESLNFGYDACPVLTAGQTVTVTTAGSMPMKFGIFYVEAAA